MIHQSWEFGKAIRPLFAEPVANIAETILTAVMLWNEFDIAEIEALWLSCIEIWGARFTSEFSVMVWWISEVLFMLFYAYTAV